VLKNSDIHDESNYGLSEFLSNLLVLKIKTKDKYNMKENNHDIILSGVHMDLTGKLKLKVREKAEKLFSHESRIVRIRFELEHNSNNSNNGEYIAKGHIEIYGSPMVATVASDDIYKSIDELVNKLQRMLRRRSRLKRVKRRHPHDIEIPADLPKVEPS